ncbi:MAG: LptF/LptG family permease [Cytophagales bacterium]|nr:LptF/LptG family permease [Armatimonadota bacterium]
MTRMDRLVLGEIVGWFVGSVLLFSSLILASGELVRLAEFLQNGQTLWLVLQLLAYTLPQIFALTFPIAMLLATLMGMGRLSSNSELTALVAAGVSFERIMLPISVFGLLVSLVGVWFTNSIVPASSAARNRIIDRVQKEGSFTLANSFSRRIVLNDQANSVLFLRVEGGIFVGQDGPGSATLQNLSIERWQNNRLNSVVFADRAIWKIGSNDWVLNGKPIYGFDFDPRGGGGLLLASSLATREQPLGKPDELIALKEVRTEDVSTAGLRERSRLFKANGDARAARDAEVEAARRVALPFASFVFALVGAPLGVRPPRTGNGGGFGIAIAITFLYWTLLQLFTVIGRGGALPPAISVMIPNLLGLGVGVFLIRRVLRS